MSNIDQFIKDPEFVRWVKNPEDELDTYWKAYIKANPQMIGDIQLAREFILGLKYTERHAPLSLSDDLLKKILKEARKIEEPKNLHFVDSKKNFKRRKFFQFLRVAAVLVFSIGLTILYFKHSNQPEVEAIVETEEIISKFTNKGEKLKLVLPDSTLVWLNSESSLQFPKKFTDQERKIILTGEAFFEVKKDELRPFKVKADGLTTTALGTSFNIKSFENGRISISLVEGKVKVEGDNLTEPYILNPKQVLRYNRESLEAHLALFDIRKTIAWKDGVIIFDQASLSEVVSTLENWYGVEIAVDNPKKFSWSVTGEFSNQTLESVLKSLSFIEQFDFKISGKYVKIKI